MTTTFAALDGPLFFTPNVYVRFVPAVTGFGVFVFVSARSETELKLTRPTAVLLFGLGSGVVLLPVAVSLTSPVLLAVNVTMMSSRAAAGSTRSVHEIVVDVVGPIGVAGEQTGAVASAGLSVAEIALITNGVLLIT